MGAESTKQWLELSFSSSTEVHILRKDCMVTKAFADHLQFFVLVSRVRKEGPGEIVIHVSL